MTKRIARDVAQEFTAVERDALAESLRSCLANGSASGQTAAARLVEHTLRKAGIKECGLEYLSADGKTRMAGTILPLAWESVSAQVSLVSSGNSSEVIADNPECLAPWSPATPAGGLTGRMVFIDDMAGIRVKVQGGIIVTDTVRDPGPDLAACLVRAGALALVCGAIRRTTPDMTATAIFSGHAAINASDEHGARLPVLVIGRERLERLKIKTKKNTAKLTVRTAVALYRGTSPVVQGVIRGHQHFGTYLGEAQTQTLPYLRALAPGKMPSATDMDRPHEIIFTVCLDENSGPAACRGAVFVLELIQAMQQRTERRGKKLRRNVRAYFFFGQHSLPYYFQTIYPHKEGSATTILSVLDVVDYGQAGFFYSAPASASNYQELVLQQACRTAGLVGALRLGCSNQGGQLSYGPFDLPVFAFNAAAFRDRDKLAQAVAGFIRQIADADHRMATAWAQRIYQDALRSIRREPVSAARYIEQAKKRWLNSALLADAGPWCFTPELCREYRRKKLLAKDRYFPRTMLEMEIAGWYSELSRLAGEPASKAKPAEVDNTWARRAGRLVPLKNFQGFMGVSDLTVVQRSALGIRSACSDVPVWLLRAAELAQGRKTVAALYGMLRAEGHSLAPTHLSALYDVLVKRGLAHYRPIITRDRIMQALRRAGVRRGDVLMVHTGLAVYGYIPDGPQQIIAYLQEAVGPEGTLCMPTHSLSWVGNVPFDVRQSGCVTGQVPHIFRSLPGVVRSLHPTHAVAARGPLAAELTATHDHTVGPMDRHGFWGKFLRHNGKILMFCGSKGANTFLHCVDLWNGAPMPPVRVHYYQNGKLCETTVPDTPFYGSSFGHIYAAMKKKNANR